MRTNTKTKSKWDHMAEALYVDYPRRLREEASHQSGYPSDTVTLSESLIVNGNQFIPANTTLVIDEEPARRN